MRILAVDDERTALLVLKDAIAEAAPNAEVYAVREMEEALAYARENAVDIAFLDINMGKSSGLDLADQLKEINPKINIIFATGYSDYMPDAIHLHASGYVMKPISAEEVEKELRNLLNPVGSDRKGGIFAHTFGNFELFVNGQMVSFSLSKSKEMLAYLIDKEGASVNRKELAAALFEDQPYTKQVQDYISKIFRNLKNSLDAVGAGDMLIKGRNQYAVEPSAYESDVRSLYKGSEEMRIAFKREYMAQYRWADARLAEIERFLGIG